MSLTCERIACLWIPSWPLQALLRARPELRTQKLVVSDGLLPTSLVLGATLPLRQVGVRVGQTVAQARSLGGELTVQVLSEAHRQAARDALYDVASSFSPSIECGDGYVLLGVGDMAKLFPDETILGKALLVQAESVRLHGRVAIASRAATAKLLARARAEVTVVAPGDEKLYLRPLPLSVLPLSAAQALLLARFGLKTLGDLVALPRTKLPARLGRDGVKLHRLAAGEEDAPLQPTPPPAEICESLELDEAEHNLEPLLFLLRGLTDRMMARLKAMSLACGDFTVELLHKPQGVQRVEIKVATPTREVATVMELLRLSLQTHPPETAVRGLQVRTQAARPRPLQLGLFDGEQLLPERLMTLLSRLQALCGDGRVGQAAAQDSHLPGLAEVVRLQPPSPRERDDGVVSDLQHRMALHMLRPPRAATVKMNGARLTHLHSDGLSGPVLRAGGPYRIRGSVGNEGLRDYYDVELPGGEALRVFFDRDEDSWFLDARYD
jgi:protein ImuB